MTISCQSNPFLFYEYLRPTHHITLASNGWSRRSECSEARMLQPHHNLSHTTKKKRLQRVRGKPGHETGAIVETNHPKNSKQPDAKKKKNRGSTEDENRRVAQHQIRMEKQKKQRTHYYVGDRHISSWQLSCRRGKSFSGNLMYVQLRCCNIMDKQPAKAFSKYLGSTNDRTLLPSEETNGMEYPSSGKEGLLPEYETP